MNDTLIDRVMMVCPMCDEEHLVEKWVRTSKVTIKGESVEYLETYYKCTEDDESFVFIPAKLMNENLLVARDAYRSAPWSADVSGNRAAEKAIWFDTERICASAWLGRDHSHSI